MPDTKLKHSRGPWEVHSCGREGMGYKINNNEWCLAHLFDNVTKLKAECLGDATLMAAAPTMKDAIKAAILALEDIEGLGGTDDTKLARLGKSLASVIEFLQCH